MSYQALYRKFRPRLFEDVVGQQHITTILKNQIQSGCSSHAYLFCGSRGTGKTSTAKIFARAINCLSPAEGEACGQCAACKIMETEDVDIIEIDAASNNGVDDMRTLIDQARFTPLQLGYKVYIIDEVHMLSNSASNALLKTLEEPPKHVKFLLATTEPQKLLATVISRCQRYDFKRLAIPDIMQSMQDILKHTGAHVEQGGLYTIARASDGGMRDALSLLDQCLAFCGENITEGDVLAVLGGMDHAFYFTITDALLASDAQQALRMLDTLVREGRNLSVFVQDMTQHLRALLLTQVCGDCSGLLECTEETMQCYIAQAAKCTQARLLRALEAANKTQTDMKWLSQPRILIESMLVRICRPEDESSILALEDRLHALETARVGNHAPPKREKEDIELQGEEHLPPWEMEQRNDSREPVQAVPSKSDKSKASIAPRQAETIMESADAAGQTQESLALWESVRKALQKGNVALYVLSAGAQCAAVAENQLIITFPADKREKVRVLASPEKLLILQETLEHIAPGIQLSIRTAMAKPGPDNAQQADLMRLFGDKLSIEE